MNKDAQPISKAKARMIYLGKVQYLGSIGKIRLMDWPAKSWQRQVFYRQLLKKTPEQVNNKWASLTFSGRGQRPKTLPDSSVVSLLNWLQQNPDALAYAPLDVVPLEANIILRLHEE